MTDSPGITSDAAHDCDEKKLYDIGPKYEYKARIYVYPNFFLSQ